MYCSVLLFRSIPKGIERLIKREERNITHKGSIPKGIERMGHRAQLNSLKKEASQKGLKDRDCEMPTFMFVIKKHPKRD